MELAEALKKAAPYALKKSEIDRDSRLGILVVPAHFDVSIPVPIVADVPMPLHPAWVAASDGECGVLLNLSPDQYVHAVLVDARATTKALRTIRKEDFVLARTAEFWATYATNGTVQLNAPAYDPSRFPQIPPPARMTRRVSFEALHVAARVTHSVAKDDEGRAELAYVHLHPRYTEASDQCRVVRSNVGLVEASGCLVSPALFAHLPKRCPDAGVSVGVSGEWLWLQVGEELRFAKMLPDTAYFQMDTVFPAKDHGYVAEFQTEALLAAAETAKATSGADIVELAFSNGSVEVRGVTPAGTVTSSQVLRCDGATAPVRVLVSAKRLCQTLKTFADGVHLFWSSAQQPLRVEDDYTTALLWPLILDKVEAGHGKSGD